MTQESLPQVPPSTAPTRARFETIWLDARAPIEVGALPDELRLDRARFDALWAMHPVDFHEIAMHGRRVKTPRWQQAYGADYRYSGNINQARPLVEPMQAWLAWAQTTFDTRLNGLLFNWYDGAAGHYMGKHRDSNIDRVAGSPVVTLSFGEERVFRMRPWRGKGFLDVPARDGGVIVIPWETNLTWTHEVPAPRGACGRRISVTLRAFERNVAKPRR